LRFIEIHGKFDLLLLTSRLRWRHKQSLRLHKQISENWTIDMKNNNKKSQSVVHIVHWKCYWLKYSKDCKVINWINQLPLLQVVAWLSSSALVSINGVTLRRARLILGWVTVCS